MNPETLTLILNIILFSVIGIVVIKMIVGLFKGLWKSTTSLIVSAILYVLIIIFNTQLAEIYFNINLSFTNLSFEVMETEVQLTTIGDTISQVLEIVMAGQNVPDSMEIAQTCHQLALSIVSLVTFILHYIVVCFILAPLLSALIYHLIIKTILGSKFVKKHKIRLGGLFVGGVKAFVSSCLLLMPFTALASNVVDAYNKYDMSLENADVVTIQEYIEAYKSSLLAQALTTVNINETTIDVAFADYLTNVDLNGEKTSFIKEMQVLLNVAFLGLEEGVINLNDLSQISVNYSALLSEAFVTGSLDMLATSPLVTTILPVAMTIAANIDEVQNNVNLTEVNWYDISWEDELTTLSDIYDEFYDTGLLKDVDFNNFVSVLDYTIDRSSYNAFENTFNKINKSSVLTKVMPYLLVSAAHSVNKAVEDEILPENVEAYKKVNLGNELMAIYDTLVNLSDLATYSELDRHLTFSDLGDTENKTMQKVIDFALTEEAINGVREDGTLITTTRENIDVANKGTYQLSTKSLFKGVYDNNNKIYHGILDSTLLVDNMSGVLKFATNNEQLKELQLDEAIEQVSGELTTREDWINEIDPLLDVVALVYNNEDLPLEDLTSGNLNIIENEKAVRVLQKACLKIDDSKILSICLPSVLENSMGDKEIAFGLKFNDLDYSVKPFGQELYDLLDIVPLVKPLSDAFSGGTDALFDKEKVKVSDIEKILRTVHDSKIINPNTEEGQDSNFDILLYNILSQDSLRDIGFNVLMSDIRAVNDWDNEITNITSSFTSIQDSKLIKQAVEDGDNFDINDIDSTEIVTLFDELSKSKIIASTMGDVFNYNLGETLYQQGLDVDFNDVDDWHEEGVNFAAAVDSIKAMSERGLDFSNINIAMLANEDVDNIEDALNAVYRLQSFNNTDDKFANFIYDNITSKILNSMNIIDTSAIEEIKIDHIEAFAKEKFDEEINEHPEVNNLCSLIREILIEDENGEKVFIINGEINFDKVLQMEEPSLYLSPVLTQFNTIDSMRTVFVETLNKVVTNINFNVGDLSGDDIDIDVLRIDLNYKNPNHLEEVTNREQEIIYRQEEIDKIFNIVDPLTSLNNSGNGLGSLSDISGNAEVVEQLLNGLKDSRLTNSHRKREDVNGFKFTFFERTVQYLLDSVGLSNLSYNEEYDLNIDAAAKTSININNVSLNGDWNQEISNIADTINLATTMVNHNNLTSFEQIDVDILKAMDAEEISTLLKSINVSNLYHDVLPNIYDQIFESAGLKEGEYLDENGNPRISGYTIEKMDINQPKKVEYWNHDIDLMFAPNEKGEVLFDLMFTENSESLTGIENFFSMKDDKLEVNHLENLFEFIGESYTFEGSKDYLLIGFIKTVNLDEMVWNNGSVDERISYVVNHKISNWAFEGMKLETFINNDLDNFVAKSDDGKYYVKINLSNVFNSSQIATDDFEITLISRAFDSTYLKLFDSDESMTNIDKDNYQRAYLLSETFSQLFDSVLDTLPNSDGSINYYSLIARVDDNNFDNDYITFNKFEIEAFEATYNLYRNLALYTNMLINGDFTNSNEIINNIKTNYYTMGNNEQSNIKDAYFMNNTYSYNAILASIVYDDLYQVMELALNNAIELRESLNDVTLPTVSLKINYQNQLFNEIGDILFNNLLAINETLA